jgi:hypothetical protein
MEIPRTRGGGACVGAGTCVGVGAVAVVVAGVEVGTGGSGADPVDTFEVAALLGAALALDGELGRSRSRCCSRADADAISDSAMTDGRGARSRCASGIGRRAPSDSLPMRTVTELAFKL